MSTIENARDKRLRIASRLDREHGTDDSRIAYIDCAGWSVREVLRLDDQRREGAFLRHCLYQASEVLSNVWSLRDPDNVPHVTFAAWRLEAPEDCIVEGGLEVCTFSTGNVLVTTHLGLAAFEDAHVERLATCANACADQFAPMPDSARGHNVAFGF